MKAMNGCLSSTSALIHRLLSAVPSPMYTGVAFDWVRFNDVVSGGGLADHEWHCEYC